LKLVDAPLRALRLFPFGRPSPKIATILRSGSRRTPIHLLESPGHFLS
jgi:hypothetical protein